MANIKISDLTAAAAATGTQEFEVNDSLTSRKVTGSQILDYVQANTDASDVGALPTNNPTFTGTLTGGNTAVADASYTGTLTGGTGVVNLGSGQFYKDASGNVGIGTSAPSTLLHVTTVNTNATAITVGGGGTTSQVNIGVGVLSPSRPFVGTNTDTNPLEIGTRAATSMVFVTNSVARAQIASDGAQSSVIPGGSTLYPEFKCRAWVNFNGSNASIRGSGNVSSVIRNGTGDYTINFTTAMPDANYSLVGSSVQNSTRQLILSLSANVSTPLATSSARIQLRMDDGTAADGDPVCVSIFR